MVNCGFTNLLLWLPILNNTLKLTGWMLMCMLCGPSAWPRVIHKSFILCMYRSEFVSCIRSLKCIQSLLYKHGQMSPALKSPEIPKESLRPSGFIAEKSNNTNALSTYMTQTGLWICLTNKAKRKFSLDVLRQRYSRAPVNTPDAGEIWKRRFHA